MAIVISAFPSRAGEAAVGVEGDVGQVGGGQEHGTQWEAQARGRNSCQAGNLETKAKYVKSIYVTSLSVIYKRFSFRSPSILSLIIPIWRL